MSDQKIYAAELVVPVTSAPLADGAIRVVDGRIAAVGPASDLKRAAPEAEVVDFGAAILLPPLVNAHSHLELTDYPQWREGLPPDLPGQGFVDWILELIRVKHDLEPEQLRQSVRSGLDQLVRSGTGAVCDILSVAALDAEYLDAPLHGWLCYELIGLDEGMGAVLPMLATDWLDGARPATLGRGLSPHAPYTVGPQTLGKVLDLARSRRCLTTMHAAESPEESAFLMESSGDIATRLYPAVGWHKPVPPYATDAAGYLDRYGALVPGTLLVHGVQFDAAAIRRLARAEVSVVLCPRSNARLGVGRAPVESYLCQGVNLALGTDSLASNDSLSLWEEMAFAREVYGPALDPVRLLAMATVGGARALQLAGELGALEEGMGANFQVLKPEKMPVPAQTADFLCRGERGGEVAHLYLGNRDVLAQVPK